MASLIDMRGDGFLFCARRYEYFDVPDLLLANIGISPRALRARHPKRSIKFKKSTQIVRFRRSISTRSRRKNIAVIHNDRDSDVGAEADRRKSRINRYDRKQEDRMTLRITEAELARDVRAVLAKVEQGSEVIIEQEDHRPVALISAPRRGGRPITEILEEARQRKSTVTLDENFGRDLEEIIASHQQPWHPPSWD
jgi:antitoxin (DNA-binding transcriptional repressor) of toxin-antitoxin stability system